MLCRCFMLQDARLDSAAIIVSLSLSADPWRLEGPWVASPDDGVSSNPHIFNDSKFNPTAICPHSGLLVQVPVTGLQPRNIGMGRKEWTQSNICCRNSYCIHDLHAARFPSIKVSRLETTRRQLVPSSPVHETC